MHREIELQWGKPDPNLLRKLDYVPADSVSSLATFAALGQPPAGRRRSKPEV
jgi:hypothetical protein